MAERVRDAVDDAVGDGRDDRLRDELRLLRDHELADGGGDEQLDQHLREGKPRRQRIARRIAPNCVNCARIERRTANGLTQNFIMPFEIPFDIKSTICWTYSP